MDHHESIKKEVILAATLLILGSAVSLTISGNNVFAKNTQAGITRKSLRKQAICVKYQV